jgi:hypothetical protein
MSGAHSIYAEAIAELKLRYNLAFYPSSGINI